LALIVLDRQLPIAATSFPFGSISDLVYPCPIETVANRKGLDFVQYSYMFTKNERYENCPGLLKKEIG
jgi:hypothetical protein